MITVEDGISEEKHRKSSAVVQEFLDATRAEIVNLPHKAWKEAVDLTVAEIRARLEKEGKPTWGGEWQLAGVLKVLAACSDEDLIPLFKLFTGFLQRRLPEFKGSLS